MSKETSKYSIAFAKALNKCGSAVQFYEQDVILGGVVSKKKGEVKLLYTDQMYNSPTEEPKPRPYPNIGGAPPFLDDYITGGAYLKLQGDANGVEDTGVLGAGKKLDDLPLCTPSPLRVDILPSITKMRYFTNTPKRVIRVFITNGGSGYSSAPGVMISEPTQEEKSFGCVQATATASISGGQVTGITIINSGGYLDTPTISITGSAEAVAVLETGVINSMNFDGYVFGGDNPSQTLMWSVIAPVTDHQLESLIVDGTNYPILKLSKAKLTPSKTERSSEIMINASMYSQSEIFGRTIIQLVPTIMTDWDDSKKFTPGGTMVINNWIFGGGSRQTTTTTLHGRTDANTVYDNTNKQLRVGSAENATSLTLCIRDGNTPLFQPALGPLCITILRV